MTATTLAPAAIGRRAEAVVLVGVAALIGFSYFARADTLGVFGLGRGWAPMTGEPLSVARHLVVAALLLGALPALAARQLTGLSWRELGLGLGNWRLGDGGANVLQTAVSVTAHFGRALNETFAALPAGLLFGWLGLRIGSLWYVAILHWLVGVSMDWFILAKLH